MTAIELMLNETIAQQATLIEQLQIHNGMLKDRIKADGRILELILQVKMANLKNQETDHAAAVLSLNPFKVIPHRKQMLRCRIEQNWLVELAEKLCGSMLLSVETLAGLKRWRDKKPYEELD